MLLRHKVAVLVIVLIIMIVVVVVVVMMMAPPPLPLVCLMTNTSSWMKSGGDHPLHSEHTTFACILWIFLGMMMDTVGWYAARWASSCSSSLGTIWSISLPVFEYKWLWMQEWIEETNSFTLNTRLHSFNNEYLGVCYTLMVGSSSSSSMLPGGEHHHHAVAYRLLLCPYSSLYFDPSDDGCMNG